MKSLPSNEASSAAHEVAINLNALLNEGVHNISPTASKSILESIGEQELSTRAYSVLQYHKFHPTVTIDEARDFVDAHRVGETPYGYPVWDKPDTAGIFRGGVGATDEQHLAFVSKEHILRELTPEDPTEDEIQAELARLTDNATQAF